jgi:hypothetical protein
MPLLSPKEVLKLKLSCINVPLLRNLAHNLGVNNTGTGAEIIKRILRQGVSADIIDRFIKEMYSERIKERRAVISDEDLKKELTKVKDFSWGTVQGQLDQKIQSEYVRVFVRYDELLRNVEAQLHPDVTNYVICTWYNHWTTILIEEQISLHERVVPTLKSVKGTDIFFAGQPFDLKVTYLPRNYDPTEAAKQPQQLAIWMYENQGAQRFGADNRFFVILFDKREPERSWELKRNFPLISERVNDFFDTAKVSEEDEVVFTFNQRTYTAVTKVLIITT